MNIISIKSIKFGGTSMGNYTSIIECADIIAEKYRKDKETQIVVTVSAVAGVTNQLVKCSEYTNLCDLNSAMLILDEIDQIHNNIVLALTKNYSEKIRKKCLDQIKEKLSHLRQIVHNNAQKIEKNHNKLKAEICSFGERLSSYFMLYALTNLGLKATRINSTKIIKTDSNYISAKVDIDMTKNATYNLLMPLLQQNIIPIITGLIGSSKENSDITMLGRGSSDYTSALMAASLKAQSLEIWTDVDGVMSADPKIVPEAKIWEDLDLNLMSEMSCHGAKVIHPSAVEIALHHNIPTYVYNTFNRNAKGTRIRYHSTTNHSKITAIVSKSENILITLKNFNITDQVGFIATIGDLFRKYNSSIDVCATSEITVSISIKSNDIPENLYQELTKFADVSIKNKVSKICIIGQNIVSDHEIIKNVIESCKIKNAKIYMLSASACNNNVTIIIDEKKEKQLVQEIHKKLIH